MCGGRWCGGLISQHRQLIVRDKVPLSNLIVSSWRITKMFRLSKASSSMNCFKKYYSGNAGKSNLLWNNKHPLFKHRQVSSNVWQIVEKYFDSWNLANFYFFKGRHEDILVDSGIGLKFQKNGKRYWYFNAASLASLLLYFRCSLCPFFLKFRPLKK